jgi:CheY-like chemotaxis protein
LPCQIIALTANSFPDQIRQCRDAGTSVFLAKPLRKPAMAASILRAIEATRMSSISATTEPAQLAAAD